MQKVLLTIWQLPQIILGKILELIYKPEEMITYKDIKILYSKKMNGGISLGNIIILDNRELRGTTDTLLHEYGHTKQSKYLGPLYLFIIGLPSLLWAAFYNGPERNYYTDFYTESWADKLGGVIR